MSASELDRGQIESSSDQKRALADIKRRVHESFGAIVISLSTASRYQHLPLGELTAHLLEPLVRNRIATATVTATDDPNRSGIAGLAIWASVSEAVDQKIRAQIGAGVFPLRLAPNDWTSGTIYWLLDVVAGDRDTAASIVQNLQKALPNGQMHLHPIVTQQLSPDVLAAMGMSQTRLDA